MISGIAEDIIARARLEGVTLFPKDEGKLGFQARGRPLSPELKTLMLEHKASILATLALRGPEAIAHRHEAVRSRVLASWEALRKARFGDQPDPCLKAEKDVRAAEAAALTRAKRLLEQLTAIGVRADLDAGGALSLIDQSGHRRDLARFIAMDKTFPALAKGLEIDPKLIGPIGGQATRQGEH